MQPTSSVWNSTRPVSQILDPRKVPLPIKRPTTPTRLNNSPTIRKFRPVGPVSPVSFVVSSSDPILPDKNKKYDCDSVFEPVHMQKLCAVPLVLSRWNEQPHVSKITFEWKTKVYRLIRTNENKLTPSSIYHKIYLQEKEYTNITSPNGICIQAEEWKEICSFYIKVYDEKLPYNGEFYL